MVRLAPLVSILLCLAPTGALADERPAAEQRIWVEWNEAAELLEAQQRLLEELESTIEKRKLAFLSLVDSVEQRRADAPSPESFEQCFYRAELWFFTGRDARFRRESRKCRSHSGAAGAPDKIAQLEKLEKRSRQTESCDTVSSTVYSSIVGDDRHAEPEPPEALFPSAPPDEP